MLTYLHYGAPLCMHSPTLAAVSPVHDVFPKIVSLGETYLKASGCRLLRRMMHMSLVELSWA